MFVLLYSVTVDVGLVCLCFSQLAGAGSRGFGGDGAMGRRCRYDYSRSSLSWSGYKYPGIRCIVLMFTLLLDVILGLNWW